MGNFPNNPLCQFNEGNDEMNGLEQDQPVWKAVHRHSPKQVVHVPYHNILSCMYGTLCPRDRENSHFWPFYLSFISQASIDHHLGLNTSFPKNMDIYIRKTLRKPSSYSCFSRRHDRNWWIINWTSLQMSGIQLFLGTTKKLLFATSGSSYIKLRSQNFFEQC